MPSTITSRKCTPKTQLPSNSHLCPSKTWTSSSQPPTTSTMCQIGHHIFSISFASQHGKCTCSGDWSRIDGPHDSILLESKGSVDVLLTASTPTPTPTPIPTFHTSTVSISLSQITLLSSNSTFNSFAFSFSKIHNIQLKGFQVTVIEKEKQCALGTSYANAGQISPFVGAPNNRPSFVIPILKRLLLPEIAHPPRTGVW